MVRDWSTSELRTNLKRLCFSLQLRRTARYTISVWEFDFDGVSFMPAPTFEDYQCARHDTRYGLWRNCNSEGDLQCSWASIAARSLHEQKQTCDAKHVPTLACFFAKWCAVYKAAHMPLKLCSNGLIDFEASYNKNPPYPTLPCPIGANIFNFFIGQWICDTISKRN